MISRDIPQDYGGKVTNPDQLLRLLIQSENLEALPRTGWILSGVIGPESVAAHSYNVAVITIWLATQLQADVGKAVQMAILHDLGEAQTTDIPSPIKRRITGINELESEVTHELLEGLPVAQNHYQEYREGVSLEARIVKAADTIQMVAKACQYARQNRGDVRRFLGSRSTGLQLADSVIERLLERHTKSDWNEVLGGY